VVNKDEIFESVMDEFVLFNQKYLYKRSIEYLSATENSKTTIRQIRLILNLSQIGMLYNLQPTMFAKGRFDDDLLKFLSRYRNRISFTLLDKSVHKTFNKKSGPYHLIRITITNVPEEDRNLIGDFLANNLGKYTYFSRQTVSYPVDIDDERIIDLKQLSDQDFIENRRKYKDLTLIFDN
jgi:hypothetical protein